MPERTLVRVIEEQDVQYSERPFSIDTEAGIIRGVKVLGNESHYSNGKTKAKYLPEAKADAAKKYEMMGVNLNHPDKKTPDVERSVRDRVGWLESCRSEADGVYADLHYLKKHEFAPVLVEMAERNPRLIGLSHNADGYERKTAAGERLIESIERVISVDLVQRPATNVGLRESEEEETQTVTMKQFVESIDIESKEKSALVALLESDPLMAGMDAPEMGDSPTVEDQVWAAFKTAATSVFDDATLDTKSKIRKIGEILKSYDRVSETPAKEGEKSMSEDSKAGDASNAGNTDASAELKSKMESMEKELADLKAEKEVRSLMESEEVNPTSERVSALTKLDEAGRKSMIAEFKAADSKSVVKPKSRSILESQDDENKIPVTGPEYAEYIKGRAKKLTSV